MCHLLIPFIWKHQAIEPFGVPPGVRSNVFIGITELWKIVPYPFLITTK